MLQTYNAVDGQSIFDICLQTYGSLDFLYRLIGDSAFDNVNADPFTGEQFVFDNDLIVDQTIGGSASKGGRLATLYSPPAVDRSSASQSLTLINRVYATANRLPGSPINISVNMPYQKTDTDHYTAGADGETSFSMVDWIGWDVLAAEDEIKPLRKVDYAWNKTSGLFTLLGGLTLDQGQTLFFFFKKMTT